MEPIKILYEDEYLIAIDKPVGILVHRTPLSEDKVFLLQVLRDQLGYRIYTIHRLDRATSGVLLFGKTSVAASAMGAMFSNQEVKKSYLTILRGWLADDGVIDYPLADHETGKKLPQKAITQFECLGRSEVEVAIGLRYPTARFSFVRAKPSTGRRHQIRKHFSHLRHPIIGDKKHGDVKHNNYFRKNFDLNRMFLHAESIAFNHPNSKTYVVINSSLDELFLKGLCICGLSQFYALSGKSNQSHSFN